MFIALIPLSSQAALPESIQSALSRAALTPADISIIITPVGTKSISRLPSVIEVTDSANTDPKLTATNSNTKNAPITVNKQEIQQQERQLHAYTDDVYTYQSLNSRPTVSANNTVSQQNNSNNYNADSDASNLALSTTIQPPLLSHQPNIARTPASTMKLVPSFIALDTLGTDFTWYTRVYHTGIIIGDRLHGDLIIQGSGDPKMTHERLQQLLYQVQKTGIRHINGDIVIDSAVFKNVSKDPAAFDNAPLRSYNASPDGFLVNFSSIEIASHPLSNGQAQLTYTPKLANYQLPSLINTRSAACSRATYSLAPQWQTDKLTLSAKLPESCGKHLFYISYPDSKDFAAHVIAAKWQQLGNTLSGQVITQEAPYNANNANNANNASKNIRSARGLAALPVSPLPIVSYPSFNLTQQIYDINHFSNNVMAEQVALSIDAYNKTNTAPMNTADAYTKKATSLYRFGQSNATSYPAALQTMNQWWQAHLTTAPPHLTNGSGLCRDCTITAANLNELLAYAYSQPSFDAYVHSLGVAGVSGTIVAHSERLPESAAIGRAWIKTGTLNNVAAMAGYVKGQSGQDYTVVGLINIEQALNPYIARPVLDAMLDWTAQH
ncbi:D-alanyl-D-alanine carboxypeptidase [Psychrobacter sp. CAL346-MNA-CIBAN-0220]|uniref:D-alanyl-D-alanine carboxypeptidase/D-alanyl-D-alanine-endopeptidase n=1 Tax=Psychrobacter sp. CAL346-MNA-CIBAN-0220 TaxID=3140457 RepID=UPI0033186200